MGAAARRRRSKGAARSLRAAARPRSKLPSWPLWKVGPGKVTSFALGLVGTTTRLGVGLPFRAYHWVAGN